MINESIKTYFVFKRKRYGAQFQSDMNQPVPVSPTLPASGWTFPLNECMC